MDGLWNSGCVGFYEPLSRERRAHPDASVGDGEYRSAAFRFVRAHPQRAAVAAVARTGRVLGVYRPFQQITFEARPPDSRPFGPAVAALVAYFVTFAAAIGGVVILRRGGVAVWPFLSISAMTVVAATATYGATRFRVPLEVALLVPAAALITSRFAPRRRR